MNKSYHFSDPTEPPEGRGREINGRRWHEAPGTRYILRKYSYKKELKAIRQNLQDGAGNYLESILDETIKGGVTQASIFGLIRMIMPSIETVARAKSIGPTTLLSMLNVPAPTLMWNLYRDMLTHNDEWVKAKIGPQDVRPQIWISMSGSDGVINMHTVNPHTRTHTLNVGVLYYDLIKYLDEEIKQAPNDKMIEIIDGVEYLESTSNEEVKLIIGEARMTEQVAKAREDRFVRRYEAKIRRMMNGAQDNSTSKPTP